MMRALHVLCTLAAAVLAATLVIGGAIYFHHAFGADPIRAGACLLILMLVAIALCEWVAIRAEHIDHDPD
ncbi:hypothetical protein [Chitiniphilus shinanonensis]|uniref:hypothetical protein n=1 Tax=Chitiniphilus shinanonensis TaxID=553088 RepID=UPI00303F3932